MTDLKYMYCVVSKMINHIYSFKQVLGIFLNKIYYQVSYILIM